MTINIETPRAAGHAVPFAGSTPGRMMLLEQSGSSCGDAPPAAKKDLGKSDAANSTPISSPDWQAFTCEFLAMRVLPDQHAYLKEELRLLESMLLSFPLDRAGKSRPHPAELLLARIASMLDAHVREEKQIFPFLLQLELAYIGTKPSSGYPIRIRESLLRIAAQHSTQRKDLEGICRQAELMAASNDGRSRGLYEGLRDFYRMFVNHLHIEDNILFGRAVKLEAEMFG